MILAVLLSLIAYIIEVNAYSVSAFFTGAFLSGMSWDFNSGVREAYIYDTLKQKRLHRYNSKVLGSLDTVSSIGGIFAALTGSVLFTYGGTYPHWAAITAYAIALIMFLRLPESKNSKSIQTP